MICGIMLASVFYKASSCYYNICSACGRLWKKQCSKECILVALLSVVKCQMKRKCFFPIALRELLGLFMLQYKLSLMAWEAFSLYWLPMLHGADLVSLSMAYISIGSVCFGITVQNCMRQPGLKWRQCSCYLDAIKKLRQRQNLYYRVKAVFMLNLHHISDGTLVTHHGQIGGEWLLLHYRTNRKGKRECK